jgi:hypothetical protein
VTVVAARVVVMGVAGTVEVARVEATAGVRGVVVRAAVAMAAVRVEARAAEWVVVRAAARVVEGGQR